MGNEFSLTIPIPKVKGKNIEKEKNGTEYINYEYDRVYVPEKRYSIPKRTTIGKKCEDSSNSVPLFYVLTLILRSYLGAILFFFN